MKINWYCGLCAFLVIGLSFNNTLGTPLTPIIIEIKHSDPPIIMCAHRKMATSETIAWMKIVSSRFGRKNPVIVKLEANDDLYFAANLCHHVVELFDKVYMQIKTGKPEMPTFLLPVSRNLKDWELDTKMISVPEPEPLWNIHRKYRWKNFNLPH